MRLRTLFISFLALIKSYGQPAELKGSWIGKKLQFMKLDSTHAYFEVFGHYPLKTKYLISKDTLRLIEEFTEMGPNLQREVVKNYDFLIKYQANNKLELLPLNSNSRKFTGKSRQINFREKKLIQDSTLVFESIKFNASQCSSFLPCPNFSLQVDNKKNILFIVNKGIIVTKKEYYTGILSDSLYSQLLDLISSSEIDKLKGWVQQLLHGPDYTLQIHYNGKVKWICETYMPGVTLELIQFLQNVYKKVNLIESTKPFDITFKHRLYF